jgi:hypothetical protein
MLLELISGGKIEKFLATVPSGREAAA